MKLKLEFNNRILRLLHATESEIDIINQISLVKWVQFVGKKRYFNQKSFFKNSTFLPGGFWFKLFKLNKSGWNVEIDGMNGLVKKINLEEIDEWIDSLEFKASWLDPRWYQRKAIYLAAKYSCSRGDFATGSGKTFICYGVSRYYLEKHIPKGKKILMIVPSVQLVKQTMGDWLNDYRADDFVKVGTISEGVFDVKEDDNVIIGNIDTLVNVDPKFFECIGGIIFDEAHKLATEQYRKMFSYVANNDLKIVYSVSGSWYDEKHQNEFEAESISGPILIRVPAHLLMEEKALTPVEIYETILEHEYETCYQFYNNPAVNGLSNKANHYELNFIREHKGRLKLISEWIAKTKMNQLCLFKSVAYIRKFEKELRKLCPDKQIYVIVGEVDNDERERIKKITEENDNVIILATYGTMSTGVSINNLFTLHLVEPPKSFIWLRQSIGRMVRLHENKSVAKIISYCDVFKKYERTWYGPFRNIVHGHLSHRIKIYKEQKFNYKVIGPIILKEIRDE